MCVRFNEYEIVTSHIAMLPVCAKLNVFLILYIFENIVLNALYSNVLPYMLKVFSTLKHLYYFLASRDECPGS